MMSMHGEIIFLTLRNVLLEYPHYITVAFHFDYEVTHCSIEGCIFSLP